MTSSTSPLRELDPELVFGVVTPIGTRTADLVASIRGELANWAYASQTVKLSALLPGGDPPVGESEDERVRRLIKLGNDFCRRHVSEARPTGDPAAVARLAVKRIREVRHARHRAMFGGDTTESPTTGRRFAFVIHSLKRPAEVQLLREIYGAQFILLGSQGTSTERLDNLLARPLNAVSDDAKRDVARQLMELDAREEGDALGQLVNDTYPLADFFLHGADVARTFRVLFGDPREAPTIAEYAMYVAHATRARSLAGSRKVGAALVKGDSVVAAGFNDVPAGETPDVVAGDDTSEQFKSANVEDTLRLLRASGWTPPVELDGDEVVPAAVRALAGGQLMSVIEYQRAVHAEAKALDDAAFRGVATAGCDLYVTTFPCHLCFKHALSAGVDVVRYIDPYSKSRAREMYPVAAADRLVPYEGAAPRAYAAMFGEREPPRSDPSGRFLPIDRATAQPRLGELKERDHIETEERIALNELQEEYR